MNLSTLETASMLSLTDDLEELDWYFEDIFDQFGNVYCLFNNINHLLVDCPLEFLLFEIQQLVSFLHRHWRCPSPEHTVNDHSPHSPSHTPLNLSPPSSKKTIKYLMSAIFYEDNMLPLLASVII